jgi:proline dehydrogenase
MPNPFFTLKQGIIRRIAASHLSGPSFSDVLPMYHQSKERGWLCAFGPWTDPANSSEETARQYLSDLQSIIGNSMEGYFSIKLTTIDYNLPFLKELLDIAKNAGIRIHFDAMDPDSAPRTYETIERVLATHRNIGCTLPSRWHRSLQDAQRVVDYGVPVRVIKGQWSDPLHPNIDARENYVKIIESLAGRAALVAVATHDRKLAAESLQRLLKAKSPCEMEQMSSLPQNCAQTAKSLCIPMRVYIPYGFPSLPYNLRHVKTRPAIAGWVMRDFLLGGRKHLTVVH